MDPRGLSHVPRALLEQLTQAIARERVECPLEELDLLDAGFGAMSRPIADVLSGLDRVAVMRVLAVVVAERTHRPPPRMELVWSGPDARGSTVRDTRLVLASLLESARESVIVAGYAFDRPEILAPLHAAMLRGVSATVFLDIEGHASSPKVADEFATRAIDRFLHEVWSFGPPRPEIYWDPRTAVPGPPWVSLHAKCVVVDGARAFVTSANFTERGQTRNIEVGALIEDRAFASELAAQWRLLIADGLVRRYAG